MFEGLKDFSTLLGVMVTVAGFGFWLSGQLNKIKDLIFVQIDKINIKIESMESSLMEKIEYHERHDDKRFGDIRDSLWEIRLRNAAMEGIVSPKRAVEIKKD